MENKAKILTLDNGLRIVTEKNDRVKTCSMGVWIASGSAFETPQTAGTSHFIEHMLFRGSEKRSSLDIAVEMDEIGGIINAYTAKEMTCVYAHTLSEHMPKAMDIICDMIKNPMLSPEDVELEKSVICEELAMYEDSPEDLCADFYYENAWAGSMLGSNILGTLETINGMTAQKLAEHLEKFYVPERMVVSLAGNFDENEAIAICKEYFGGMKNTSFPISSVTAEYNPCIATVKKDFMQNQLILGFPALDLNDERRHAASLMSSILGSASSSRLFQRIREELGLVYSVDCASASHMATGIFMVCMGLSEKSEEKAIAEALKIISEFPETVTEKELARAKEQNVASLVMGLESVSSLASRNGRGVLLKNKITPEEEIVAAIRGVTLDELKKTSAEILDTDKVSFCSVGKVKAKSEYEKLLRK